MNIKNITLAGMFLLAVVFAISIVGEARENQTSDTQEEVVDDIEPYEGSIGPGNALYGLKIAFENLDETFTFNASEKLGKQVSHARLRIAEAKAELKKKNSEAAEKAFERYMEKTEETNISVHRFSSEDSGLEHAFEMIKKHQNVLENLNALHPNIRGLKRAYENSLRLEEKFREKIEERTHEEEPVKIEARIIGNDTQVEVKIKFKSENTTNFTIAQEIRNKFQLSTENINILLTVENMDDEGKLETELEAEAEIEDGFSKVEAEYKFPLLNTTNRTDIVSGINQKLASLTIENITSVLEIKEHKEGKKAIKEEKREIREEKKEEKEAIKEEKREIKEEKKEEKEAIKEKKHESKEERKNKTEKED